MRDPYTLYCSFSAGTLHQSNDLSSQLTLSSDYQDPLTAAPLLYDMSAGYKSWGSAHKDGGQWSPEMGKALTAAIKDPSSSKPQVTKGKSDPRYPEGEKTTKKVKKKNYQRYAKPPYSYLAMTALVIQNSPDKMLKLSQVSAVGTPARADRCSPDPQCAEIHELVFRGLSRAVVSL